MHKIVKTELNRPSGRIHQLSENLIAMSGELFSSTYRHKSKKLVNGLPMSIQ